MIYLSFILSILTCSNIVVLCTPFLQILVDNIAKILPCDKTLGFV